MISSGFYHSPLGWIEIRASEKGICTVHFVQERGHSSGKSALIDKCIDQLKAYFNHERKGFKIKLDLQGTEFQVKVWKELRNIRYGKTTTYAALAIRMGNKKLFRAVGKVNSLNPIAIIVPCHRVLGSNQRLVGYKG